MEQHDRERRERPEDDHGPRLAEKRRKDGERARGEDRRERRVAEEQERRDPDRRADPAHDRRDAEERAARRRDGLPTLLEAQEEGPPVAEHRGAAGQHTGEVADEQRPDERRTESLRHVQEHDGDAVAPAEDPPHVGGADVPAPDRPDVDPAPRTHDPVPGRDRPREVADEYDERGHHRDGRRYFRICDLDVQSLIVDQSRLSKKASMYEARSVWWSVHAAWSCA